MALFSQIFQIQSDEPDVRQKGRVIQGLVVFLTVAAYARAATVIGTDSLNQGHLVLNVESVSQVIFASLLAAVCLGIIHRGHPTEAAHIFFISLNIAFFLLMVNIGGETTFPYLMLISVVAIAAFDSVRASVIYAVVVITAVTIVTPFYKPITADAAISYILTATGISVSSWIAAQNLQTAVRTGRSLAQNLQQQTHLMSQRAAYLQRSANISQATSASLNLQNLLHDIVHSTQQQFGFYHTSLFLLDEQNHLNLRESTGSPPADVTTRLPIHEDTLAGRVALHRQLQVIADSSVNPQPLLFPDSRSQIAFPIVARGQLLGVLQIDSQQVNSFQEPDVVALQILVNQMAAQIDNARLFEQTAVRLNETNVLLEFNTLLTTTLDVGEIYRRASRRVTEQLNITRCVISTWEREANSVTAQVEFIHDPDEGAVDVYDLEPLAYNLNHYKGTQQLLQTRQPWVRTLDDEDLETAEKEILLDLGQYTCLELPLVQGNEAIGIMELFRNKKQPRFNTADIQLAQAMANQTAIALQNAQLTAELQTRVAQFSSLNRLNRSLATAPTLKEIFSVTRRELLSLVEATGISIILTVPDPQYLRWIYGFEYGREVDLTNVPPIPVTQGFSGHVARTRQPLLINQDMREKIQQLQSFNVGADTQCWLGVPLLVANNLIGIISVENGLDPTALGEREVEILKTYASTIAIAINNFLQFEEIQAALAAQSEQRLQLQTAAEVAAATTSILNLNELIDKAVNLIKERFALYYVGLFLCNAETNQAILKAGTGPAGQIQLTQGHRLPIGGRSLIGGATADGTARIIQDVLQDDEWLPNPNLPETRSELALPLRVQNEVLGALTVQSQTPQAFKPELISTLQTMCDQMAIAIRNVQLLSHEAFRAERQRQLNQIGTRLHRSADVQEIISIGLQSLSHHLANSKVLLTLGRVPHDDAS